AGIDTIKSTKFDIECGPDEIKITGFGWGHGVGLSQEGGKGMAEQGKNYKEILRYYYTGVEIRKARLD
ncbi:MAG TPA: hypothetical protein P5511_09905, partial [Candidatus Goldiibacteriota bacterium]|nr:hypothetical protein [Candidatus Goldiibacteriota bacterium]